ncbi:MAG TPA: T9SS type A sorting domain-containing protein, partial [Bacteroidia bacterium]|nr:T9SS type A sorting domain-containing protein [Bacteroidia bacterium]
TASGAYPSYSSFTLVGGVLCGATAIGGALGGTLVSIDTDGTSFTNIFDFSSATGMFPSGIINNGNTLYGMTLLGGLNREGVIFKFKETDLGVGNLTNGKLINIFPNPSSGIFTLSLSNGIGKCSVEVYNVMGQRVKSEELRAKSEEINLSEQPNGVYFYRVIKEDGGLVGEGKVVIEK